MKKTAVILLTFLLSLSSYLIIIRQLSSRNAEFIPTSAAEDEISPYEEPEALLLPEEAVVYNFQELKAALEDNNGITTVYFGADITMQVSGIKINPNKQQVIVSGRSPLDPDRTEPYTLTDYNSSAFTNTIYINARGINTLIVRDMNIVGKNFYGPFSILDSSELAETLLIYERVNYNGPQLGYHRRGTVHIEDCLAKIHGGNGGSANQEFSEVKHLVFKGANSIDTESSSYSIFWHPLGGSFILSKDSSLTVTSPNTSALYGVFYADSYLYEVDITIGERASLDMTISGMVASDAYISLSGFTVCEAGSFALQTTKSASATVLSIAGALTVEKEASFIINGYGGDSQSLLKQADGDIRVMKDAVFHITSQNAYSELLNLVGRSFLCNDPASVLLTNGKRTITATTNSSRIYINAQQINHWDLPNTGGLDAPAPNKWTKSDRSNFIIDGTLSTGAKGDFTVISSNSEDPSQAPDATSFSMEKARVLAFGRLELDVDWPEESSMAVSGVTKPDAAVRVSISRHGEDFVLPDVTADSTGAFHIPIDLTLDEETIVTVRCGWQFLSIDETSGFLDGGGKLELFVPGILEFFTSEISPFAQIIKRAQPSWMVTISDGRGIGGGWKLYARLNSDLTPNRPGLQKLEGALIFIDHTSNEIVMSKDTDVLVASHITAFDKDNFSVSWDEDKGILLFIKPGTAFTETIYKASIIWTLIDAP